MKLERVVVAIDFSERSIAAAQWVAGHFAPQSELVLVHALELPPPPLFLPGRSSWSDDELDARRTRARTQLRELGGQIRRGPVWEEVRVGRPHEEILRVAREYHADLIVVGSHRERESVWIRLGSTAERVIAASRVPVLAVHGAPREAPRIVLAAVDDSETGLCVIEHARTLAERFNARGEAVHVLPPQAIQRFLTVGDVAGHDYRVSEAEQQLVRATQRRLAQTARKLKSSVVVGDPAEAILAEARHTGSHLLVIGRERGTQRFSLGSVASVVTRVANCPVLVIPGATARAHARGREFIPAVASTEDAVFTASST